MLTLLAIVFLFWLVFGYFAYGRWIAKQFELDDSRETPANAVNDGEDFVPIKRFYLFGQHFSAIAAAGPIAGPIATTTSSGEIGSASYPIARTLGSRKTRTSISPLIRRVSVGPSKRVYDWAFDQPAQRKSRYRCPLARRLDVNI